MSDRFIVRKEIGRLRTVSGACQSRWSLIVGDASFSGPSWEKLPASYRPHGRRLRLRFKELQLRFTALSQVRAVSVILLYQCTFR